MLSVIVLEPAVFPRGDAGRALVVRSLSWLVGATVAGLVGDVALAATPDLDLDGVADAVGCRLAIAHGEGGRLRAAAAGARKPAVLTLKAGYAPDTALTEELARRDGAAHPGTTLLLSTPATFVQRLLPDRAPAVGVLASAALCREAPDFAALVRSGRRGGAFTSRARPLS